VLITIFQGATAKYWSTDLALSSTEQFLWATVRGDPKANSTGWISLFQLNDSGAIQKKLFTVSTTTTSGTANAIAPAPFDDQWAALTDYGTGYVQIWQVANTTGRYPNTTAKAIARVDIPDGGCCANAIWYD
jgi:carboxy-cis,cis-muconate cyclase